MNSVSPETTSATTTDPLERLRELCLALPETSERLSHGESAWFVRDKTLFVMYADHHHDDVLGFWCAAPPGAQEALTAADHVRFFVPPYVGHRGWLGVRLDVLVDWREIAELVTDAYRTVAPKRLVAELDARGPSRLRLFSRAGRHQLAPHIHYAESVTEQQRAVRVAIDSGQTGLRLRVVDSDLVGEADGFTWSQDPITPVLTSIRSAWRQAVGTHPPPVDVACCGLTGWPADDDQRDRLTAGIADVLDARRVRAGADMVTAHAGALPDAHGVVLAIGTGVVALGLHADTGRWARVDGWGHLLGDGGSAFAIGRAGVDAVLRAHDGRGPDTALTYAATQRFARLDRLAQRIYTATSPVGELAGFAPVVLDLAEQDPVAADIIRTAAAELARTAAAASRAVTAQTDPHARAAIPLACTGRLLRPGSILDRELDRELRTHDVPLHRVPPVGGSLDGAARLAARADLGPYAPLLHEFRRP